VRCWGANAQGELGADPSSVSESALPLPVPQLSDATSLALSVGYSCATTTSGNFLCWGSLAAESAGGVHREHPTPAYEPSHVDLDNARFEQVTFASVGPAGGAVLDSQTLVCWGSAMYEQRDAGSGGGGADAGATLGLFSFAAVGRAHACAATPDRSDVECWGDNARGQCGVPPQDGSVQNYPTHVGLSTMNVGTITGVAVGSDFSCALTSNGTVYCWGANDVGQLGNPGVFGDQSTPTQVQLGPGIVVRELTLGDNHGCVATAGYAVHCWGDDSLGQLGDGGRAGSHQAMPVVVQRNGTTQLGYVEHVAAGGNTTCATRLVDNDVWCWGANESGQAGQSPSATPVVPYATPLSL
jgi:alpha-tubulin suppressor-like RCC1 family protein